MEEISLTVGPSALTQTSSRTLGAEEVRTDPGEIGAIGVRPPSRLAEVARGTCPASLPINPYRAPQRKSKTIRLRELQTLVPFPASTLRRMTRDGIFVKAARGVAPVRKWNRRAVEQWLVCPQLEVGWPASDAYGTAHDPAPEIRSHIRAILGGSTKPTARVSA